MTDRQARIKKTLVETRIQASPQRVWKALTEDIGKWWPGDFYAGGADGQRNFLLEGHPGGRMFEQWDDGGGVLWGTVTTWAPAARLQVLGATFPNWGGPNQWYGTWDLSAEDDGTRLTYSESTLGSISDAGVAEKFKGWTFLNDSLKAFVEGTPPPAWQE